MRTWWDRLQPELEPALVGFFQTLLGRPVRVVLAHEEISGPEEIDREPGLWVRWEEGRTGTTCWLLWTESARRLLEEAMLGQAAPEPGEASADFVRELTQQLQGAIEPILRAAGVEVKPGQIRIASIEEVQQASKQEPLALGRLRVLEAETEGFSVLVLLPRRVLMPRGADPGGVEGEEAPHSRQGTAEKQPTVQPVRFPELSPERNGLAVANLEMLADVHLEISVELGRRAMPLAEVLRLTKGSLIELDKLAGEPVDILVNGRKIAQGEVVVIDENFGVRIIGLVSPSQRLRNAS